MIPKKSRPNVMKELQATAGPLLKQLVVMATSWLTKPLRVYSIPRSWIARALTDTFYAKVLAVLPVVWLAGGGRMRLRDGHLILFHPRWLYDATVHFNFLTNWMTGAATFCLNAVPLLQSPDWATDSGLSPKLLAQSPEALPVEKLTALKASVQEPANAFALPNKEHHVMQLFDSLPAATPDQLLGKAWRGRVIRTGRFLDIADAFLCTPVRLLGLRWGKRYITPYVGDPLCFTFLNRLHIPQPLWGNVGMHSVSYRGRPCATMAYDHQPWHDYFAVLDDGAESGRLQLLGLWCHREKCGGWFTLTQMPDVRVS